MSTLILVCLLGAAPTQLEQDVAALTVATERFETARAAVSAAETKLAAERVVLRAARSALWAAIRKVQEDLGEGPQPTPAPRPAPQPVVWSEPLPTRIIYQQPSIVYPIAPRRILIRPPVCSGGHCYGVWHD